MKEIKILIKITDKNIARAQKLIGYNKNNMHDQLEVLGVLEDLVSMQKEKLKTLAEFKK